ncbi:MAG: helix-turn-helix domain-containing protein, partial [Chloroflexota bacterium]
MALTIDDKQKILALRTRGFSYDRIAKELDYSPTTVRKVVLEVQGDSRGEAPLLPGAGPPTSASPALPQEYQQFLAQQALGERKEDLRSQAE